MRTRQRKDPWRKVVAGLLALVVVVAAVSAKGRKEEAKPQVQSPKGQAQSMVYVQDTAEPEELPVHIPEIHYAEEPEKEIPQEEAKPDPEQVFSEEEITAIAKTVWGEALVTNSDMEMAAVAWCILNRVDSSLFPNSIVEVVTAPSQFHGYSGDNPVPGRIRELVLDVLGRWLAEKDGEENVGRVLPSDYLYFWGDGWHNHFTTEYLGGVEWDWSLPNPYES